ncbi:reverse transcriptase domain-containing protein [Tanacetum coccineum]
MSKFASTFKSLLSNKEKLFELASTPLNENCSAVLLKKFPEKLGDPDKFLIPCDFPELDECLALADLGASINLMPLSVWKKLSLPKLTLTRMTLELVNRSVAISVGVAEDVFVKVGKFYFLADFVIVDYDVNPRVRLILGRPFLRMARALIDVHDVTCEEYAQEVLGFSNSSKSGNPTPSLDPIITTSSPSLTPFEGGDFILEEIKACLTSDSIPPGIDDADFDPEGDIRLLEKLLNDDTSSPLPPKELNFEELKIIKSSIDDPPELELKDLPSHLEYAFLEENHKLPVIISKELKDEEKFALLKVLKSHKWAIAWKISDIKGIDPHFYTHKILMEDDFKPAVKHQRRVNPKNHEVSPVHCVPKKGGMIVVENDDNELIPTRFLLTRKTKKIPPSLALMGRLPTDACLSVYVMLRARSKGILLLQEFDVIIHDKKGAENLAADHLSRLENPHQGDIEKKKITETFPLETLRMISFHGDSSTPWFIDIVNYHARNFIVKGMSS